MLLVRCHNPKSTIFLMYEFHMFILYWRFCLQCHCNGIWRTVSKQKNRVHVSLVLRGNDNRQDNLWILNSRMSQDSIWIFISRFFCFSSFDLKLQLLWYNTKRKKPLSRCGCIAGPIATCNLISTNRFLDFESHLFNESKKIILWTSDQIAVHMERKSKEVSALCYLCDKLIILLMWKTVRWIE